MTALYIISFILLVVATIALLKLTPEQINKDINELFNKQQTLKDQALMARGKKRKNRLILELERIRRALQETGKEKQFSLACTAALLLMVAGCIVAIAIDNMFLIPVLAIACRLSARTAQDAGKRSTSQGAKALNGTSFLLYPYLCSGARTGTLDFDGNALLRRCNRVKNTQKQKSRRLYRRSGGGSRHRSCFSLNYQHLVNGHAQAGYDVYV